LGQISVHAFRMAVTASARHRSLRGTTRRVAKQRGSMRSLKFLFKRASAFRCALRP
jgi:hypothetical protein